MLKLPFAYNVHPFNSCQQGLGSSERAEPKHRPHPSFDVSVVLLYQIIQVCVLPYFDVVFLLLARIEAVHRRFIGSAFIKGHDLWWRTPLLKKRRAASLFRLAVNKKSTVLPAEPTAR